MSVPSQVTAMMARVASGFLTETCTIEQEDPTRGQFGEPTHDWAVVAAGVACRLISNPQRGSASGEAAGAETLLHEYRLIVPLATTLEADMRVTVNDANALSRDVFNVVRVEVSLTDRAFRSAVLYRRE